MFVTYRQTACLKIESRIYPIIVCERGGNPRVAYPRTFNSVSLLDKSTHTLSLTTHTHICTLGYPSRPAGASRPLRELKATEDKQERGETGEAGEAECTAASTGEENVQCIVRR